MEKPKILVVDDELDIAYILKKLLEKEGYEVICVDNGFAALDVANREKLFAITLDMMMEDKTGWEVIHSLKNNKATADIPIVVISSLNDQIKKLSLKLGVVEYIVKPFTKEKILYVLEKIKKLKNNQN
ncbi:MAG TPA: response regulator [bacterium]|nr:response regulator [bacterium]HOL47101.1 response regulator [bacterium]HPQ18855.1 response regulator [bacterium]